MTAETLPPFADRYELSTMRGYVAADHHPEATFDLFFRDLPPDRGYAIAAGLERAIHAVETVVEDGERVRALPSLDRTRDRTGNERRRLPEECREIRDPERYEVRVGSGLSGLTERARADLTGN